jgi:cell division septation protein DedD
MTANRSFDEEDLRSSYSGRGVGPDPADREISLGTPTILGIFFALALALAAVFGLGYTLGRRSAQSAAVFTDTTPAPALSSAPKPSAGTSGQPAVPAPPPPDTTAQPVAVTETVPLTPSAAPTTAAPTPPAAADRPATSAPQPATSNPQPETSYVVQVAAVSSQDVADILTSSLQKKGYTVAVRHEPQDKLLHVQIGPFTDKKDAEAMRARVLADGFNAIVK